MKTHENHTSNDSLTRENKMLQDKVQNLDNKVQELNIEIQEGYKINTKLEIKISDYMEQNEKLNKENELLKKSKAQKEKYIAILLKEKEKMLESTNKNTKIDKINNKLKEESNDRE